MCPATIEPSSLQRYGRRFFSIYRHLSRSLCIHISRTRPSFPPSLLSTPCKLLIHAPRTDLPESDTKSRPVRLYKVITPFLASKISWNLRSQRVNEYSFDHRRAKHKGAWSTVIMMMLKYRPTVTAHGFEPHLRREHT
jgi:hypothetical protein